MKIGMGYDVHRLSENRKFIMGGVEIPYRFGLLGHSDADVLLHAVMDAVLGALALGDIGTHFPDSDPNYQGISSLVLTRHVAQKMRDKGFQIGNLDAVIVAQKPKMKDYIEKMRENIAEAFSTEKDNVSVKATTEEGLGFTGNGEGIAAYCVCLLEKSNPE